MRYQAYSKTRLKIIALFFLIIATVLIVKLFNLQVLNAEFYQNEADRQYATPSKNIYERGSIYFQEKSGALVSAASQISGYKVAIDNTKISKSGEDLFNQINSIASLEKEDFMSKISKSDDTYEEILHYLDKDKADKISALKISGLSVFKEKWRSYPAGAMAAHTIGFVGYNGDDLEGRYGLEREYNDVLSRGEDSPYINFFAEIFSDISDAFKDSKRKNGDIITSIEPSVQSFLEKSLTGVKAKYEADSVGGIIINPQTGAIYAMSAQPNFNPNSFTEEEDIYVFSNPLVENVFEFGSVVKPLVMAAGLDAGVVKADTKYNDKGSVIVEKKEIFNFDKKGRGANTTMQEVLNQSLNTGMVFVYEKLGKEKMREYLYGFGIKEKTGIDLPNETRGLTNNLESPRDLEYANASFGQGIALTPVGMVRALSSLANGGNLITPHIVHKIKYKDGTEEEIKYTTKPTMINQSTSEEITRMLVGVMDQSLAGGKLKLTNYSIAVKTGTAQVANLSEGGYYADRHMHSFFGYFPAYNPQFLVFLYAVNPKGTQYASTTWTNPFVDAAKFLLNYYEVPPDR